MMKANELRIGNWVQIDNEMWPNLKGVTFQITSIEGNKLSPYNIRGVGFSQYDYNLEPIPLTEEILLKCGFKKGTNKDILEFRFDSYIYWIEGLYILEEIDDNEYSFYHSDEEDGANLIKYGIKYLHQLQNLYFALTGEELEINL